MDAVPEAVTNQPDDPTPAAYGAHHAADLLDGFSSGHDMADEPVAVTSCMPRGTVRCTDL